MTSRGIICPNITSHSITKKLEVSCTVDKTGNEIVSGAILPYIRGEIVIPMTLDKQKFYAFRNWSIYQVSGMIKMLEKMRGKAHDMDRVDITATTHDMSYALEHLCDLRDNLSQLTLED